MARSNWEVRVETDLPPDSGAPPQAGEVIPAAQAALPVPIHGPTAIVVPATEPPTLPDRSAGLTIFGVVQIILGLLAALMVPFVALAAFMSRLKGGMHPRQFITSVSFYAFIAVALLCLGVGSVQAKRWARALTLVSSWYWLVSGVLGTILMTAVLPVFMRTALQQAQQNSTPGASPEMTTGVMAVMLTFIIVLAAFFLIVVPIGFIIFYSREDVAETCRRRDPVERWTDRTPLPVLGGSMVLAIHAFTMLGTGIGTPLFPFFGRHLYGITGTACFLLLAALDGYLAVAFFRLKTLGWWIAAVTTPIRLVSMALTYLRSDIMQAYSKMGMSEEQLRVLNSNPVTHSHATLWWNMLSVVILYGYLLWLKRYFKADQPPAAPLAQSGPQTSFDASPRLGI
jgi:hypothetical protein